MTNTATEAIALSTGTLVGEIQVSGAKCFEGWNWREAILYYLNGMDSDKEAVTYRPKIHFGVDGPDGFAGFTLRLDGASGYVICDEQGLIENLTHPPRDTIYARLNDYRHVEHGLRQFVRSDKVSVLCLSDAHPVNPRKICFRKMPGVRAELHVALARKRSLG